VNSGSIDTAATTMPTNPSKTELLHSTVALPGNAGSVAVPSDWARLQIPRGNDLAVQTARIVVCDDSSLLRQPIVAILLAAGFTNVVSVQYSRSDWLNTAFQDIDLLIVDSQIDGLDMDEFLQSQKELPEAQHLPVIALVPAGQTTDVVSALNRGANDVLTKPTDPDEMIARIRNTLSAKTYRDQVASYSLKLESDVLSDPLTRIANRRAFDFELKRRLLDWNRERTPLGLIMIDIDHFKSFNDQYGHQAGDTALCAVAQKLTQCVRDVDLIARYGGEEFAMILPASASWETKVVARRVRSAIEECPFDLGTEAPQLTVSVGLANVMNGDDVSTLVRRADTALYAAKEAGRNRCYFHDGGTCSVIAGSDLAQDSHSSSAKRSVKNKQILIIDNSRQTVEEAKLLLQSNGYTNCTSVTNGSKAFDAIAMRAPDLVLLDGNLTGVSAFDILRRLRQDSRRKGIPVLLLTDAGDDAVKAKALEIGADDFLEKPFRVHDLVARVGNTLLTKSYVDQLADYAKQLELEVRMRTAELIASRREAIQCLARAAELRDDQTGKHIMRVGRYAALIATELGFSEERVTWIEHAAQLHDVGKIGVPDAILRKPSQLTAEEFEAMQEHCLVGRSIIRDENFISENSNDSSTGELSIFDECNSPIMRLAAIVACSHHERWDGTGYPFGLAGEQIPVEGRIAAIADVFDALSTKRAYKESIALDDCFRIMHESRGSHFDPAILDAFIRRRSDAVRIYHDYSDS
jgi:putative two-component system response regulator